MRWFCKLLHTKSPTLGPSIVDELKQCPPCSPLDDIPSRYEVKEAIRALANRKAVEANGGPAELLKVLADEGQLNTLGMFYDIIVAVWRGDGVPSRPKITVPPATSWQRRCTLAISQQMLHRACYFLPVLSNREACDRQHVSHCTRAVK